ncbi:Per1 protein [Martiniozyma asiatica (nom. inval.)]|nr:Per1 protein [Martiniozyma asiatica]
MPEFESCLDACIEKAPYVNIWLQFLGWDVASNCDYICQREITAWRESIGLEVVQFHGKWPFIRVFGIQELFSTIFSIGNFIPHYYGFKLMYNRYRKSSGEQAVLYSGYVGVTLASMGAWFFSTIFHLKDTWNRERLDYFFAGLTVLCGFHVVFIRIFQLHLKQNTFKRILFSLICALMYIYHVTRLMNDWSYTYNMQANVFIGILQYISWFYISFSYYIKLRDTQKSFLQNIKDREVLWALKPFLCVCWIASGMMFEMFDFSPWFDLIDAHAMWHLVTIWPVGSLYKWIVEDIERLSRDKLL